MNGLSKIFVRIARNLLGYFDVGVTKMSTLNRLAWRYQDYDHLSAAINFLDHVAEKNLRKAINIVGSSKSQLHQDIFVLVALDFKRNGFFVEFGATNGVVDSNSWLLENKFGWEGIVAEPGKRWQKQLKNNRHCQIPISAYGKIQVIKFFLMKPKTKVFQRLTHFLRPTFILNQGIMVQNILLKHFLWTTFLFLRCAKSD